jgi:hypothetical protein
MDLSLIYIYFHCSFIPFTHFQFINHQLLLFHKNLACDIYDYSLSIYLQALFILVSWAIVNANRFVIVSTLLITELINKYYSYKLSGSITFELLK